MYKRWLRNLALLILLSASRPDAPGAILAGPIINPQNNHAYYLLSPSSWSRSQEQARALGGNLVTINDSLECEWIVQTFIAYGGAPRPLWIGLTDRNFEGSFAWVSGESSSFQNWHAGEPNNDAGLGSPEHFAFIYPSAQPGGKWRDANEHATSDLETDPGRWNTGPDGDIGCFGLVEINGIPVPVSLAVERASGLAKITWAAQPGGIYQLYQANSLEGAVWFVVGEPIAATDSSVTAIQPFDDEMRFFRVVRTQP